MWQSLQQAWEASSLQLDAMIAGWGAHYRTSGGHLYCGAGCSGCCTLFVQATLTEAVGIAPLLNPAQVQALEGYVARQHEALHDVVDLKSCLRLHRKTIGPCPFLDPEGRCGIYQHRPHACRALLSTRPADWCSVDFSELSPLDKELYLGALDRSAVAFPMHYVAATQDLANELEQKTLQQMGSTFSMAISGNLPLLVYLERRVSLSTAVAAGPAAVQALLSECRTHPLLLHVEVD